MERTGPLTRPGNGAAAFSAIFSLALVATLACSPGDRTTPALPTVSGPLAHGAFVWQRQWTPAVYGAIRAAPARGLRGLVALGAEIEHRDDGPRTVRVAFDLNALAAVGPPGLALRIGGLSRTPYPVEAISDVAAQLDGAARRSGHPLAELQIDHDCPTRRLNECADLLEAVRRRIAPTPLTFTALPSWLEAPEAFARLAEAADGYVLQVHSLDDPGQRRSLVDLDLARRAVASAARVGVPFRVALPTHAYLVHLDPKGRTVAVDAEGGGADLGPSTTRRLVSSDPAEMATLVREWSASRPKALQGIVWFRLPVDGDRFNWTASTLEAVMDGQAPTSRLAIDIRRPQPGLAELDLVNRGESAEAAPLRLELSYPKPPLAGDGLGGYRLHLDRDPFGHDPPGRGHLDGQAGAPLRPGERRPVAWLRFTPGEEVSVSATFGESHGH